MKHYGDITQIKGAEVPIVDIVTGGSPCQDLSVAGKRAGLDGERSGLFMEQVRVFKEMRDECIRQLRMRGADVNVRFIRPRFFVWENVPGAFSSNKGEDFRCVLEEVCRIADKDATVPMPEKGKWSTSGCIMGDGYSVAWRVHDAQFWGVAQRRKRIALVGDFGGLSAPEILFERKSMSGNIEESREQGQGVAANSERSFDEAISFQERAGCSGGGKGILIQKDRIGALSTLNNQSVLDRKCLNPWDVQSKHIQPENGIAESLYSGECRGGGGESYVMAYGISGYESNAMKSSNPHSGIYEADTTRTLDLNGGNPACNQGGMMVVEGFDAHNIAKTGEQCQTLTSGRNDTHNIPCVVLEGNGQRDSHKGDGYKESDKMYTLNTVEQHAVCYSQDTYDKYTENNKCASLKASGGSYGGGSEAIAIQNVTGPLMASGYQKNGTQEAMNGMYVVQTQSEHYADVITKE